MHPVFENVDGDRENHSGILLHDFGGVTFTPTALSGLSGASHAIKEVLSETPPPFRTIDDAPVRVDRPMNNVDQMYEQYGTDMGMTLLLICLP